MNVFDYVGRDSGSGMGPERLEGWVQMAAFFDVSDTQFMDLCCEIDRAAYGRIRQLSVREDSGHLVLEGVARCFHDKQKAQEAAFSASRYIGPIANRIRVECSD